MPSNLGHVGLWAQFRLGYDGTWQVDAPEAGGGTSISDVSACEPVRLRFDVKNNQLQGLLGGHLMAAPALRRAVPAPRRFLEPFSRMEVVGIIADPEHAQTAGIDRERLGVEILAVGVHFSGVLQDLRQA